MPVRVKCSCGKALSIPDAAVGKSVNCPSCGKMLKVPGARPAAPTARPATPTPAPAAPVNTDVGDLFAEEGMDQVIEAVCPVCRAEMPADAVLCVKCGYHKESGTQFESHKTAGVDIDHGTLALQKAEDDMARAKNMQDKMLKGAGLPWWGLALVLFVIGSGLTIAVLTVNAANRTEKISFDAMGTFFVLSGSAFGSVALGAYLMFTVFAFKKSGNQGLLVLIPPYALYYVFTNFRETWKFLAVMIVTGTACGVLIAQAVSRGML